MYVNMHELANLAASRAQEMQLPLPPPPASLTVPGTDKVLRQTYYLYYIIYLLILYTVTVPWEILLCALFSEFKIFLSPYLEFNASSAGFMCFLQKFIICKYKMIFHGSDDIIISRKYDRYKAKLIALGAEVRHVEK